MISPSSNNSVRGGKPKSVQWHWNLPLLFSSSLLLLLLLTCVFLASRYRTSRIAAPLSQMAAEAHKAGDFEREVRWLSQLVAIEKNPKDALVRLAFATIRNGTRIDKRESARVVILRAIAALDPVEDVSIITELRRELIQILLGMGTSWANELERQIVLLDAPPGDPMPTLWLAKCLYAQARSGEWRMRDPNEFQQADEYWQWLGNQTVGFVLEQAVERNPDSIEVAAALLDTYFFQPELFRAKFVNESRASLEKKGIELLGRLKQIEDGLAQWKSYSCEATLDPSAAKEFLVKVVPQALDRLESARYEEESGHIWDIQLVLTQANHLSEDADYLAAIGLYRRLLTVNHVIVPPKLLENVYVGIGQALLKSGKIEESIAILRKGCEQIGKNHGLAIFDTYATYACTHADLDEATRSLSELNDAINTNAYQSNVGAASRGEAKNHEQNRINLIKWHADVVRAGLDIRTGKSDAAISKLRAAVAAQLQIPNLMRAEASAMLARVYSEAGLWELAARTFDDAVALAPEDRSLRLQAAKAAEKAGESSRASEHWTALDDGSFESSLNALQSILENRRSTDASLSENSSFAKALERAKLRLNHEKQNGASPKSEWLLDWLEMSMKTTDFDIEESLRSLMSKYPDNGFLLSLLIQECDALGNEALVAEGMKLLERIKESNPSFWLQASLIRAVAAKDLKLASEIVKQNLADEKQAKEEVLSIAFRTLETRCRGGEIWETLRPHLEFANEAVLFSLGQLLVALESERDGKQVPVDLGQQEWDIPSELNSLIERLSSLEGPSESLAQFLKAIRLMERFDRTQAPEDLQACAGIQAEIAKKRPRWPLSIALAGNIAGAQGENERAVECFRQAINEGDNRISTILDLVRQLNLLGRYEEAEFEFERVAPLIGPSGQVPELALGSLLQGRKIDRTLEVARAGVKSRPEDANAWLSFFQAAQPRLMKTSSDNLALLDEAENAIDTAISLSGGTDVQLWLYKIRFASQYRGFDVAGNVVERFLNSSAPEKDRTLIAAKSHLQLGNLERAKKILDAAIARDPKDEDLTLAMVEYYRTLGDSARVVATLEEAIQIAPSRVDIKNSLALALLSNDLNSTSIPWDRIESLVRVEEGASAGKNQLFHAILLASRGDEQKTQQARNILKGLINQPESKTDDDALRYSIILDQKLRNDRLASGDEKRARELATDILSGFDRLTKRKSPAAMDLAQQVDFLFVLGKIEDIPGILNRLESLVGTTEQSLAFRIRLAHAKREQDRVLEIIRETISREEAQNRTIRILRLSEILAQQGLQVESVRLLQAAYERNPVYLRPLVEGLLNQGDFQKGFQVCSERSKVDNSPELISVVADFWTASSEWDSNAKEIEAILDRGLKAHPDDAMILESVGSLRLSQFRYEEAFRLLEAANRLSPDSLLTLNNLAIAASEIPGKESLGLSMIDRAIAKYGRMPDLIDSRGLVLLRIGSIREARESFDEAYALLPDPRFRLHRIQVDMAESDEIDPNKILGGLNLDSLRAMKLTPREKTTLDQLVALLDKRIQVTP